MATRAVLAVIALVLGCLAVANAQCIECSKCNGNNYCLSTCKKTCEVTINVEDCKRYGYKSGEDAAKEACDLSKQYCGTMMMPRSYVPPPYVTLGQCGNAAYGTCQSTAKDKNKSPCGSWFGGVAKCNQYDFRKFYDGVVDSSCNQKTAAFDKPQGRKF